MAARNDDGLTWKSRRPIVELTPHLDSLWLARTGAIPEYYNERNRINLSLKVPGLDDAICVATQVEVQVTSGEVETIRLSWGKQHYKQWLYFLCPGCQKRRRFLYLHRYRLRCRFCARAVYKSQVCDKGSRPRWKAAKVRARYGIPQGQMLPPKPPRMWSKTYRHIERVINSRRAIRPVHNETRITYRMLAYYDHCR
jgi:hypothetical protein